MYSPMTSIWAVNPVIYGDPMFVDMAHGNYHLRATQLRGAITYSRAIDFAPLVPGVDYDLGGRFRDQDIAAISDVYGYRDLGAYEMQPITDRVFADGLGDPVTLVY